MRLGKHGAIEFEKLIALIIVIILAIIILLTVTGYWPKLTEPIGQAVDNIHFPTFQ